MNIPSCRSLKAQARVLIMEKRGFLALVTFVVTMVYLGMSWILNSAFPFTYTGGMINLALSLVCSLLVNIVYYLFCAGQAALYLCLCRGQEIRLQMLTGAFSRRPEPVAVYASVQFVIQTASARLFLWNLMCLLELEPNLLSFLEIGSSLLALLILFVWLELGLSMAFFVYCDNPQQSGLQLLRESLRLMIGNRPRLLYMTLSFAGIMLLVLLSSGIGLLFAQPYFCTVQALFYLSLRKAEEARAEEEAQQPF